jgi:tetratricopeptide (TPR) repeat protein
MSRALVVVVLVSLGARTLLRNVIWGNPVALWTEARDQAPDHWLPSLLLGEALHAANRRDEAVIEYTRGIALRPDEAMGYQKLGVCLIEMERLDDATAVYEKLRQRDPQSTVASIGLGAVAMVAGRPERARAYFIETIDHDGSNVIARQSLAMLAESDPAKPAEALRLCREIQQIAPDTPGNDDCIRRNQSRLAAQQAGSR